MVARRILAASSSSYPLSARRFFFGGASGSGGPSGLLQGGPEGSIVGGASVALLSGPTATFLPQTPIFKLAGTSFPTLTDYPVCLQHPVTSGALIGSRTLQTPCPKPDVP